MRVKSGIAVAAGLCLLIGLTGGAGAEAAQKMPKPRRSITITGCPAKAVPEFCVRMGDYNITGAVPPAPMGRLIVLQGERTDGPSICPGVTLQRITWRGGSQRCW